MLLEFKPILLLLLSTFSPTFVVFFVSILDLGSTRCTLKEVAGLTVHHLLQALKQLHSQSRPEPVGRSQNVCLEASERHARTFLSVDEKGGDTFMTVRINTGKGILYCNAPGAPKLMDISHSLQRLTQGKAQASPIQWRQTANLLGQASRIHLAHHSVY